MRNIHLALDIVEADGIWKQKFDPDGYSYTTEGMHTYPHQPLTIEYVGENKWEEIIITRNFGEHGSDSDTFYLDELLPFHFLNIFDSITFNPFDDMHNLFLEK